MRIEFSKKLLIIDYFVMVILCVCTCIFPNSDFTTIAVAWVAQIGVSTAAYYWKTKFDNRTKVPMKLIESLPDDIREQIDLTQVMIAIIQSE